MIGTLRGRNFQSLETTGPAGRDAHQLIVAEPEPPPDAVAVMVTVPAVVRTKVVLVPVAVLSEPPPETDHVIVPLPPLAVKVALPPTATVVLGGVTVTAPPVPLPVFVEVTDTEPFAEIMA